MLKTESLVKVHRVGDGIVPFQSDDGKSEDGELRAEDTEEAGNFACGGELPLYGVPSELSQCGGIQNCQKS